MFFILNTDRLNCKQKNLGDRRESTAPYLTFLEHQSGQYYKDVRKELDLSLQITRTNTLDVY